LPFPYSTDCFDYKSSDIFKSRGQCVNKCIIDDLLLNNNNLKISKKWHSLQLIHSTLVSATVKTSKAVSVRNEAKIANFRTKNQIFTQDYSKKVILHSKQKYTTYVIDPIMSFAAFLSTTGGLLGLWNNLSINDLQYYC
jgi:hypothetical protein